MGTLSTPPSRLQSDCLLEGLGPGPVLPFSFPVDPGRKPQLQTHFYAFQARKSCLLVTFLVIFMQHFLVLTDGGLLFDQTASCCFQSVVPGINK